MKRWKYRTEVNLGTLGAERELNEFGSDGWELVCVVPVPIPMEPMTSANWLWVFKQEEQ